MQNRREPRYVYRIYGLKDRNPANRRKYDANMIHLSDIMGADTKFGFSFQANDAMMDIVTYNRLGLGDSGFTETYFYQKLPDGRYSRTYQINSSDRATGFVQYRGKNYFMEICCALENDVLEYDYDYCQLYYFCDGYPQETVRLTPEDNQITVTVRKRYRKETVRKRKT